MAPRLDNSSNVTALPMIVRFLYTHDGGPTDGGRDCVLCPHCGSKGRYIHHFICDDGQEHAAMSGCIKLFPVSIVAQEHMRLSERLRDLRKRYGATATLNSWETKIMDAIESVYNGTMQTDEAVRIIKSEKAAMAAYRQRKHGKRGW